MPEHASAAPRCLLDVHNVHGEGSLWDARTQTLSWVDLQRGKIHQRDEQTGALSTWTMPDRVTVLSARAEAPGLLAGLATRIILTGSDGEVQQTLATPEPDRPGNRTNDGRCDSRGRFWFGTMQDACKKATGALYCYEPGRGCRLIEEGWGIPNGFTWSLDNKTLYVSDSLVKTIYAYDFDLDAGTIANRRVFHQLPASEPGVPDGATLDSEGYLWSAVWDGWRIIRYRPDGRIDRVVPMPVQRPSSCIFGGAALDRLYITTAITDLTPEQRSTQPLAGGLFVMEPGVHGVEAARYAG